MGVTTYSTVNGILVEQCRDGSTIKYVSDTLGSVIKTVDAEGVPTFSVIYWPYGEVRTATTSNPSSWGYVGTLGYNQDATARIYVRARMYRPDLSRWMNADPLWPKLDPYQYVGDCPTIWTDYTGLHRSVVYPSIMWTGESLNMLPGLGRAIGIGGRIIGQYINRIGDWMRGVIGDPRGGWPRIVPDPLDFNYGLYCGQHVFCEEPQPEGIDCADKACRKHDNCAEKLVRNGRDIRYWIGPGALRCHCELAFDSLVCLSGGCTLDNTGGFFGQQKCETAAKMILALFSIQCRNTPHLPPFNLI